MMERNVKASAQSNAGTRVFKKTSPNGKITTYLGKRDFLDHLVHVDLIDGMVLVDPEGIPEGQKVYANLIAAFRYGREDLDVLGLTFRKDLLSFNIQVYPPVEKEQRQLTRLQERLKKKLGPNSYPFWFQVPANSASSVTLQPAPNDTGKPCGVDYELKTYVAGEANEANVNKKGCVRLAIRKLTYAPPTFKQPQPSTEVSKEFMLSQGLLHMEASLDKEMYYHGESISVNIHIQNNTGKSVKKIKVAVVQVADICLFSTATYTCEVARLESTEGFPVAPGGTLSKVFTVCPLLQNNREKRGLALDGKLKHEDTNLASSTIIGGTIQRENLGIVVNYKVRIKLSVAGALAGELSAELAFTLTHPKPLESSPQLDERKSIASVNGTAEKPSRQCGDALDTDLIKLDTESLSGQPVDDDIIFEDFARLRLRGVERTNSNDQQPPAAAVSNGEKSNGDEKKRPPSRSGSKQRPSSRSGSATRSGSASRSKPVIAAAT